MESTTPAQRMASAMPQWTQEAFVDPINRSGERKALPPRRSHPVAVNHPPVNRQPAVKDKDLVSVGSGVEVYLKPEDGADPNSDEGKHRFRSLKPPDDGASVIKDGAADDLEVKFKGIKAKASTPLRVEDKDNAIEIGGNEVGGFAEINIGGSISVQDGIVTSIFTGERGGTGNLLTQGCDDTSPQPVMSWTQGIVQTDGDVVLMLGECSTGSEGS